jgi:hypothetical protein
MKRGLRNLHIFLVAVFLLLGSKTLVMGQGTDIISYSFPEQASPAVIDDGNHTVEIEVEYGTSLNGLVATFTLSDSAVADVGPTRQESGVTSNDFSGGTVTYTVTDTTATSDPSFQDWDVTVTVAPNTETDILTFSMTEQTGPADIDNINHSIDIEVAYGTDITSLSAIFTLSDGAISNPSSGSSHDYSPPATILVTAEDGTTTQEWTINVTIAPNNETDILTYSIPEQTVPAAIDDVNHTVDVTVDFDTDVTALVATFTLSDQATAEVGGTPQVSGSTANDFSGPVTYTVIAGDGSTEDWTVVVSKAANNETDFLTYSLPGQTGPAVINNGNHTINVEVPFGTNVTNLVATFSLSPQATATVSSILQVSGTTPNDFTSPVTYTVEAGDGSTEDWEVTVTFAANSETDILTYSLDGFIGAVNTGNHTVTVAVPFGTEVANMVATFTLSPEATASVGGSLQESGVTALDFSSAVTYLITAGDGTTNQDWTVTVNVAENTETDFISYSFPEAAGPATINTTNHTIDIEVLYGTSLDNLVATFELSEGATARISGTLQTSGVTANNFNNTVTYRVFAEDGSTFQDWEIDVSNASNFATEILTFSLPDQLGNSVINETNHTVEVVMPYDTDLSSLVATFTLSTGANANIGGILQTSGTTANDFSDDVIYNILAENGVDNQDWTVTVTIAPNSNTSIFLYSFSENAEPSVIDNDNYTIDVKVVYGTDLTDLVASFTLSDGASATVGGINQNSGVTSNDFTNPVTYRVTAQDGITFQDWVITVEIAQNTEADILTYGLPEQTGPADIDEDEKIIRVEVFFGTDVTSLVATFTLSDSATATVGVNTQTSGVTANNFTNDVTYVVTSQDGSTTKPWVVVVSVASNTGTDILTYSFEEQTAPTDIDTVNHTIDIEVDFGINLTNLVASFTLSPDADAFIGPVRQVSGETSNDFSSPVTYTVRAGDGSTTQNWIVNVDYGLPNSETDILSFNFDEQVGETFFDTVNYELFIYVAEGTELDRLVASFELSTGASAYIGDSLQISGETVNDFTSPVVYTILAQDNSTRQNWTVHVTYEFGFEYVNDPTEFPVSTSSIQASARLPVFQGNIDRVMFVYKKLEDPQWSRSEVIENQGIYSFDITRDMVGNVGMYYYFDAIDTIGSNIPLEYRQVVLHYDTDFPQIPNLRFGTTVNHYQIIAIPLELQNTDVEAVFEELGEYNIKYWRLFRYDGTATREYQNGFMNIDPGLGYWLIAREQTSITTGEGRTVEIDSTTGFQIDLEPGWNHIGNPYDMDISWDYVRNDNDNLNIGRVNLFNRDSLIEGNIIPRFRGGFVFLFGQQPLTVNLKPSTINSNNPQLRKKSYIDLARENSLEQSNWISGLKISNGTVTNTLSGIGMHPEAVEGIDRHDKVLLPVPEQIIPFQLVFNHPDEKFNKFSMDVVQTSDQYIWEFEVKSYGPSQTLTISWDNRYFGNNAFRLILNHKGSGSLIDMKNENSYTFNASGSDQFRILFGDSDFIHGELKPKIVVLGEGYPNPFRDRFTIPFTLPDSDMNYIVNISIYDMKGNMVRHLVNDEYASGYHTVDWNSMEDAGEFGRGIYLIRMTVRSNNLNTVISRKILRQ